MFKISYHITENLHVPENEVTDTSVRYYWFLGDIKLQTSEGNINILGELIPIVDFALAFKIIYKSLLQQDSGYGQFDFTDNCNIIDIYRKKEQIEVHPSFEGDILIIDFEEFCNGVEQFYKSVIEDVFNANPYLRQNKEFLRIITMPPNSVN